MERNRGGRSGPGTFLVQSLEQVNISQASSVEDPPWFQAPAHPSFRRFPRVGKLLERASAKASPYFLLLKLPE